MPLPQSSIANLYAKEFRNLRRYVRRTVRSSSEAQDIVQEAYLRLLTLPPDYPSLENPRAFLFVVASHLALDRVRQLRRSKRFFLSWSDDSVPDMVDADIPSVAWLASRPEDETDAILRWRCLLTSINALEPKCHQAFVMHKINELPYKEVASQMGITVSMVEKHLSKAIKFLGIRSPTSRVSAK